MGLQRGPHDPVHVVPPVKADQAGPDTYAMFGELGQSHLDRLGHRRRVPWPGHPVRVQPDDEDAGRSSVVHVRTIPVEQLGQSRDDAQLARTRPSASLDSANAPHKALRSTRHFWQCHSVLSGWWYLILLSRWRRRPVSRRENVMNAATDTGLVPMRVSKAVALGDGDDLSAFMVLDELEGDRHLVIGVGDAEALALDAGLPGLRWGRPMTYEFTAALGRSLGGRVREVRLDRIVEGAYAATVEVEGPPGMALVDARSSDALNL